MQTRSRFPGISVRSTLAVLMISALMAGCGVSKSKYTEVTKSRDDLAAKNQQLQQEIDQVNQDKAQLQSQNAALNGQVKEMGASAAMTQQATEDAKRAYSELSTNLASEVNGGQVEVRQLRDVVSLNLSQDVLFQSGSATLDKNGKVLLDKVADNLKTSPFRVLVTGHTDNKPPGPTIAKRYPTNWELGAARAATIARLFEKDGIAKERLAVVSFADSRPRETNDTAEGRSKNRRIEIKLVPPQSDQTAGQ